MTTYDQYACAFHSLTVQCIPYFQCSAFWWIAGDCFGFRRNEGIKTNGEPFQFASKLRYQQPILSYTQQLEIFCQQGFCLWDVIASCERKGSLDQAIQDERPNNVRGFCLQHPSIQRIVLANGTTGSKFFVKHNREWLQSGELVAADDEWSQKAFAKACRCQGHIDPHITLVSALSVSPAAARYSYEQKRSFWEEHVYASGQKELERAISNLKSSQAV
jgi:G:T/U-mismatch repair DNA glycosylase